jgi:hypothetical protein
MLDRLMRGHTRAGETLTDLAHIGWTLVHTVRFRLTRKAR